jgi:hypothetical protein
MMPNEITDQVELLSLPRDIGFRRASCNINTGSKVKLKRYLGKKGALPVVYSTYTADKSSVARKVISFAVLSDCSVDEMYQAARKDLELALGLTYVPLTNDVITETVYIDS